MVRIPSPVVVAAAVALGACTVTPPAGPSVMALPPQGKGMTAFQQDDVSCRQYASQQIGNTSPQEAANQSAANSVALGTVLGAAAGAAIGAAVGNPAAGAAIGAGSGFVGGAIGGAQASAISGGSMQQRYDISYTQCMASHGDSVTGTGPGPYASGGYGGYPYPYAAYPYPYYPYYPYPVVAYGVGFGWGCCGGRYYHRWR
ncbi:MAG TPA: glycine zipper family protein [Stellaceae bacterium]|nr:glycine zipper family protein [Stellaceae bacterium]